VRVLASADIHGNRDSLQWVVEACEATSPDVVVLAGDLLGCPSGYEEIEQAQEADAKRTVETLETIGVPVLFIMGNDDLVTLEPRSERLRSLHGTRVDFAEFNFVGYQYSLPFMGGVFEKPEQEIAGDLADLEQLVDRKTVLVTHSPVYGRLDLGILDQHAGSRSLLSLVERKKPRVHVHGHIHSQFGRDGVHFNVAADMRARAVLIDVERLEHSVVEPSKKRPN